MSRQIDLLLEEYGESHKNHTNKAIHWICVPLIFWSIVSLFYSIPNEILTEAVGESPYYNWASIALVIVLLYYLMLSKMLAVGMFAFGYIRLYLCIQINQVTTTPIWILAIIVFVLAWIGQFYGHHIEGKKPSFLKDIQFLLIGPGWLLHFIYLRLGIKY